MNAVRVVGELAWGTVRLWARTLAPLLVCLLLGYLAFTGLFAASWRLGARDERLGLPVLAVAQLASLAAMVGMFLLAGRRLPGLRHRADPDGEDLVETEERVLDVVVLTLAPFLVFYSLWGLLEPLIADHTLLAVLNEGRDTTQAGAASWLRYLPVAAGAWLLKSVLVRLDRGRRRPVLAALVALLEAIWLFLAFWALTKAFQASADWFGDRLVWHWITGWWYDAMTWLERFDLPFSLSVPEALSALWQAWREVLWPGLKDAVGQPLVWLAITALVFRRTDRDVFDGGRVDRAVGRLRWNRRLLVDVLTRDYRDKYLPLVAAVRLVLRLGLPFLAALCVLYVGIDALGDWLYVAAVAVLDDSMQNPSFLSDTLSLGHQVLVQPLQICLLAVAYERVVLAHADEPVSRTPVRPAAASGS
jgi:hypothetical protein